MDFLLQSYKRNRNWIFLKQLLLLMARMTAMILLALMLCIAAHYLLGRIGQQMGWQDTTLAGWFGGRPTHHYVLLDDSFSMSDRGGDAVAFDRARQTIQSIAMRAGSQENQRFTLIRFSQALGQATADDSEEAIQQIADLNSEIIDKDFAELLEQRRNAIAPSQLSVGPQAALRVVGQLLQQREGENSVVYVVSDFRAKEWDNPAEVKKSLVELKNLKAEIELISCVRDEHANLGVVDLAPENETRAAGVPLFFNVSVKNFGSQAARKVQVKVRSTFFDPVDVLSSEPEQLSGEVIELPTVLLDEIGPGETLTRRFQVSFPKPGRHVVEAELPEDPVAADNFCWSVVEFLEGVPVLVIDNSATRRNAYYLSSAFDPGRKNTGIRPEVQSAAFLRDVTSEALNQYHTIYLLDVDRLDERAVGNLEEYVRGGGGLGIFCGSNVNIAYYNGNLYRDGEGLFPVQLDRREILPEEIAEGNVPDIIPEDTPPFSTFAGERNSFLNLVSVAEYLRPAIGWSADDDPDVHVLAKLRGAGHPLAVERKFGSGRVFVVLTTITKDWTNWPGNPTFPIFVLKLQAHLATARRADVPHLVGAPIELQLVADKFRKDVTFVVPGKHESGRTVIEKPAARSRTDSPLMSAALGLNPDGVRNNETDLGGVYEGWSYTNEGGIEVQRWAVNVDSAEGDLTLTSRAALLSKLGDVQPKMILWNEFDPAPLQQAGFAWSKWILVLLIVLLLGEQILAYAVSYHPTRGGAR